MVLSCLFLCLTGNKDRGSNRNKGNFLRVSYNTLLKATDNFSSANLIGAGTFGSVYKVLFEPTEELVAVKVFNLLHQGALKTFMTECEVLRGIRHRNIVKIITTCSSIDFRGDDFKAVVYEFMEKGSLEEWLHPTIRTQRVRSAPKNLSLVQRLDIAINVASALDYLHNHCGTPLVHCDLKPSNILLNNDLTGKVSDFGLARFLSKPNDMLTNLPSANSLRGPVSYVAPEYETGSEPSTYGDVYSFGILLLEMFTGNKPTDDMFSDGLNLHKLVNMSFCEGVVAEIADSRLLLQGGNNPHPSKCSVKFKQQIEQWLRLILEIGIVCSSESPRDRMDIRYVVSELNSVRDKILNTLHDYSPTIGVRSRTCSSCMVCRRRMNTPPAWKLWSNNCYRQFCESRLLCLPYHDNRSLLSLEVLLLSRYTRKSLSLIQRLEIAIDVACALDFLHNREHMGHRDLKLSDVMVDRTLMAAIYIGVGFDDIDALVPAKSPSNLSNNVSENKSITGHWLSEVQSINKDISSFGIILLEIFTGKRSKDLKNIHDFVKMAIPERVTEIADSTLLQRDTIDTRTKEECLISIFQIGIACSATVGYFVPQMRTDRVVLKLHSLRDRLLA